jgi:hypothetical protein
MPASSEVAVAGLQRARLVVGSRSGRRVGSDSLPPALTVYVPPGASTGRLPPARELTVVVVAPISMSKVRPCLLEVLRDRSARQRGHPDARLPVMPI